MNYKERDQVQVPILKKLKYNPNVLWYQRTASFRIGHVTVGSPGTPDITAVVKSKSGICLLFIECKALSKKKWTVDDLPYEQRQFFKRYAKCKHVVCAVINDPKQLSDVLKKARSV